MFLLAGMRLIAAALLVSAVGVVIGFRCISMWARFGAAMRRVLADPRRLRVFNLVMSATLVLLAADILR